MPSSRRPLRSGPTAWVLEIYKESILESLKEILVNPSWWFTVVIAGVLVNLIAAYLKTKLDTKLSSISDWWRDRSEKRKEEERLFIEKIKENKVERYKLHFHCVREPILGVYIFLMGIFFMLGTFIIKQYYQSDIIQIAGLLFGSVVFLLSFYVMTSAIRSRILLFRALSDLPPDENP